MNNDKIKESFQELLKQKKYTSISIQNITDHAQISRRTFYQYYESKLQLFEEIVGDFIEWSLRPFEKNDCDQIFSSKIKQFTYVLIEHIDTLESLFNEYCPDILVSTIEKILTTQIQKDYKGFFINKLSYPPAQKYYVSVISMNCAASIHYVLDHKDCSKTELIDGLCKACDAIAYFYHTDH